MWGEPPDPRAPRRERFRVRVPDGSDEPTPVAAARDRIHGPIAGYDVHQREPRARGRPIRRRGGRPGSSPRRGSASLEDHATVSFVDAIRARASARPRRIALPETDDPRTLEAARALAAAGVVEPVLVGPARAIPGCEVIDPSLNGLANDVAAELLRIRGPKGMSEEEARRHAGSRLVVADALVRWGRLDGCVAGAVHTTGDVLRAAL